MNIKKKTIVLDARMLNNSGIGTYIKNTVKPISEQYDFIFLGIEEEIAKYFPNAKVIKYNHPIYSIKEQLYIPTKVPRCDVFWSPHINIPLLPVLTKKRLVTIHDMFHAAEMPNMSRIKKTYTRLILNSLNIYKPEVITVSEFSKKEIVKYTNIPTEKITVAYNGFEASKFIPSTQLNTTSEKYILYVGNVKPHKNLNLIVEAFRILKNENSLHIKLKIIGKKEGFITGDDTVIDNIKKYNLDNDIEFTGKINDAELVAAYQNAEMLVFPSKYEGFGLPPLEAMACNCPGIVSDIEVFKELYQNSVIYTPVNDPFALSQNIKNCLNDNSNFEVIKQEFPSTLEKFTWEKSQEIHLKVLEKILNPSKTIF